MRCWWRVVCRQLTYDRIPGYRRLSWSERKRLDHAVACHLLGRRAFWRSVFGIAVATVLMYVVTWENDSVGARRDLLRALPLMASFPALAASRRKIIRALLRNRDADHGQESLNARE